MTNLRVIALFETITISLTQFIESIHLSFNLSIVDNAGRMSNYIKLRTTGMIFGRDKRRFAYH